MFAWLDKTVLFLKIEMHKQQTGKGSHNSCFLTNNNVSVAPVKTNVKSWFGEILWNLFGLLPTNQKEHMNLKKMSIQQWAKCSWIVRLRQTTKASENMAWVKSFPEILQNTVHKQN